MAEDFTAEAASVGEPRIRYPARETVRATLAATHEEVCKLSLAHAWRVHKASGRHDTAHNLMPHADGLLHTLRRYAGSESARGAHAPAEPGAAVPLSRTGDAPAFRDVAEGPLAHAFSPVMDWAEAHLTLEADASLDFADPASVRERAEWLRVVRLAFAATVFGALDYAAVWAEVDGDAGWKLAEWVAESADAFADENSIDAGSPDVYVSGLLASLLLATPLMNAIGGLRDVARDARRWQAGPSPGDTTADLVARCHPAGAAQEKVEMLTIHDVGKKFPFPFVEIPSGLTAKTYGKKDTPPEMHWRPQTEARVRLLFKYWEHIQRSLGLQKYRCVVTAGSLKHGGRHPPHKGHRTGCEVDVDVPLPELALSGEGPFRFRLAKPSHLEEELIAEPSGDVDEADESGTATQREERDSEMEPRLAGPPTPDWRFPVDRKSSEWYLVARKFTQAIYLTCPGSIILASQQITRQAKEELLERLDAIIDEEQVDCDPSHKARPAPICVVRFVLSAINIEVWKWKSYEQEYTIRHGHRHHWHVNYFADLLGDVGPWRSESWRPKSSDGFRLDAPTVAAALEALNEEKLWMRLLEEPPPPFK